ncbi:hypothetical protein QJQ45_008719 [Haematococcus lacustris]|nr:hypothetical protein QJQ45_008719 [Haematococcus lacustris]
MQRPLEMCQWDDLEALPPIGEEYQQRYKLVNDRLPKVFAKKGKGKGALRQSVGVSGPPGVPGLGGAAQMNTAAPAIPPIDPDNAEFVAFVRARNDRDNIESSIKKQYPPWANVASKDFSYGFTVRDKSAPEDWKNPARLTELPPAQVLEVQPLDRVKDFFSVQNLSTLFTTDPAAAAGSSSQPKSSS